MLTFLETERLLLRQVTAEAHDALLQRIVPETPDKNDPGRTNQ